MDEEDILRRIHEAEEKAMGRIEKGREDAKKLIAETEQHMASQSKQGEEALANEIARTRDESIQRIENEASKIIDEAKSAAEHLKKSSKGRVKTAVDKILSYIVPHDP